MAFVGAQHEGRWPFGVFNDERPLRERDRRRRERRLLAALRERERGRGSDEDERDNENVQLAQWSAPSSAPAEERAVGVIGELRYEAQVAERKAAAEDREEAAGPRRGHLHGPLAVSDRQPDDRATRQPSDECASAGTVAANSSDVEDDRVDSKVSACRRAGSRERPERALRVDEAELALLDPTECEARCPGRSRREAQAPARAAVGIRNPDRVDPNGAGLREAARWDVAPRRPVERLANWKQPGRVGRRSNQSQGRECDHGGAQRPSRTTARLALRDARELSREIVDDEWACDVFGHAGSGPLARSRASASARRPRETRARAACSVISSCSATLSYGSSSTMRSSTAARCSSESVFIAAATAARRSFSPASSMMRASSSEPSGGTSIPSLWSARRSM